MNMDSLSRQAAAFTAAWEATRSIGQGVGEAAAERGAMRPRLLAIQVA